MALLKERGRRISLWVHRWLGLLVGPLFMLLALTGSLLVFYVELDAVVEPRLNLQVPTAEVNSWQRVLDGLVQAHPDRINGWRIELPPEGRGVVTARYLRPVESAGAFFAPLVVSVHPATGEVLASRLWGDFLATWLYDLHYSLLTGASGRTVVGVAGLLLAAVTVLGVLLWWPRRGHWRTALAVKWNAAAPQRRHYDLHKWLGLGSGFVVLMLALTGSALALPDWVEPLFRSSGASSMPLVSAPRDADRAMLSLDDVLVAAHQQYPEAVPRWVDTPASGSAVFRLRMWLPGDPSRRFPHSYLWLHGQTGELLAVRDFRLQPPGETALAWLHPLHNGEALGLAGRIVVLLAGLVPVGLFWTGLLRWRDRRRARVAAQARSRQLGP